MKRYDFILIGLILVLALIWGCFQFFIWGRDGAVAVVSQDGQVIGSYSLSEDMELEITDDREGKNTLVIEMGQANITEADCPDKLCVKQKAISKNGESIICLPHRLVIEIAGGVNPDIDALAR